MDKLWLLYVQSNQICVILFRELPVTVVSQVRMVLLVLRWVLHKLT